MTDKLMIEETINGLQNMIQSKKYIEHNFDGVVNEDVCERAIKLLKEQEAVNPIPPEDEFSLYRCGNCYHQLFRCIDKYCSRCGRAVKWE